MPPWMARATGASWYLAASCLVNSLRGRHSAHTGCDTTPKPAASNMACFTRMVPILLFAGDAATFARSRPGRLYISDKSLAPSLVMRSRLIVQRRLPVGVPSRSDAAVQGHANARAGEQRRQRIFGRRSGQRCGVGLRRRCEEVKAAQRPLAHQGVRRPEPNAGAEILRRGGCDEGSER